MDRQPDMINGCLSNLLRVRWQGRDFL